MGTVIRAIVTVPGTAIPPRRSGMAMAIQPRPLDTVRAMVIQSRPRGMDTGAYGYPATTVAYEDPAPVVVRRRVGYYGGPVYRSRVAVRRAYGFRSAAI